MKKLLLVVAFLFGSSAQAATWEFSPSTITVTRNQSFSVDLVFTVTPEDPYEFPSSYGLSFGTASLPHTPIVCNQDWETNGQPELCWKIKKSPWDYPASFLRPTENGSIILKDYLTFIPNVNTPFMSVGLYAIGHCIYLGCAHRAILIFNVVDKLPKPECNRKRHQHQDHAHIPPGAKDIILTETRFRRHKRLCSEE